MGNTYSREGFTGTLPQTNLSLAETNIKKVISELNNLNSELMAALKNPSGADGGTGGGIGFGGGGGGWRRGR